MEKLAELMPLQLQQHRKEMQAQERRFREKAERQHADMQAQEQRFRNQTEAQDQRFREQAERQQANMKAMLQLIANPPSSGRVVPPTTLMTATPTFAPVDSTSELWKDYRSRFLTFTRAHAVPDD